MNSLILEKVDEIINDIINSNEYQKYLNLKDELDKNKEIKSLISEIKLIQKDLAHNYPKEMELENKIKELESIPLYREYQNILSELNNTYNIIESTLNNYFSKLMN